MERRNFIDTLGKVSLASIIPISAIPFHVGNRQNTKPEIIFGLVTDVHKDLIPDADDRLQKFIQEAISRDVDFIIQLGDFCFGDEQNRGFLNIWEEFSGDKYHVLGNHDMDKNSKEEVMAFWGMNKNYYSYDVSGYHFIVLDANFLCQDGKYIDYKNANFYVDASVRTFISPEQIEWLKNDLDLTSLPTIVFSHQSLWHYQNGVNNRLAVQKVLEAHADKIICCLNGHNHQDFQTEINGIKYVEVNSMSYYWMADKYRSRSHFPEKFYDQYSNLPNIAPYEDPLYAFVTLKPHGALELEGVQSKWVSPNPSELGMPEGAYGNRVSAQISNYEIKF